MSYREREEAIEFAWDKYWAKKDNKLNKLYDLLASGYRKLVIRKALNHFVKKYFASGENVLHAGCGSGEVDVDIANFIRITALDISANALNRYQSLHGADSKVIQGSLFALPLKKSSFDGLYNLGVLEHFTQSEINQILLECKRVLRPGGKIIVFWPPVFGISVVILSSLGYVLNKILKLRVKFYPDEINRVKSRTHATAAFKKAGFQILEYYFGPRDIFTQVVVVAQKPFE